MKTVAMIFTLALVGSQALAQEQTRIYGPDGRSLGTAAPYGTDSVRYRDSRSRTTFTTTTMNGVTRFYDSGGHLTAHGHWIASPLMARSSRPCPPGTAPL